MPTDFEKMFQRPVEARHLLVNPFGPAILEYRGRELVDSSVETPVAISTNDFKFRVTVNADGSVDIQRNKDDPNYLVDIYNGPRCACTLQVEDNAIRIAPNYLVNAGGVVQTPIRKLEAAEKYEERENASILFVKLAESKTVRRVDFRYRNGMWVSIFMHNADVISVRPNGDYFAGACSTMLTNAANHYARYKDVDLNKALSFGLIAPPRTNMGHRRADTTSMPMAPPANVVPRFTPPQIDWSMGQVHDPKTGATSKTSKGGKTEKSKSECGDRLSENPIMLETVRALQTMTANLQIMANLMTGPATEETGDDDDNEEAKK